MRASSNQDGLLKTRKREIEAAARTTLGMVLKTDHGRTLASNDPIALFDPQWAARELGFHMEFVAETDFQSGLSGLDTRFIGFCDRSEQLVRIASTGNLSRDLYTAAHEIGHIVLHTNQVEFRDHAISDHHLTSTARPLAEQEADYFAACYLMPWKILTHEFKERIGLSIPLGILDYHRLLEDQEGFASNAIPTTRFEVAKSVAALRKLHGRSFDSLADLFRVSKTAMAKRLMDLNLV